MESIRQANKSGTERLILLTYKGTLKELLEEVHSNTKEIDFASLIENNQRIEHGKQLYFN